MRKKTDNELLDDVLAESGPAPDFREALLGESLRLVRRRRRFRQARNVAVTFLALVLLGIFIWPKKQVQQPSLVKAPSPPIKQTIVQSYTVVPTQPLPASDIVTTHPFGPGKSEPPQSTVEIVETTVGNYRVIGDEELLALVAAHPAALVRTGPHSEQLVFANPQDAKGFPLN